MNTRPMRSKVEGTLGQFILCMDLNPGRPRRIWRGFDCSRTRGLRGGWTAGLWAKVAGRDDLEDSAGCEGRIGSEDREGTDSPRGVLVATGRSSRQDTTIRS